MTAYNFVLCDPDERFVKNFINYYLSKANQAFNVYGFTECDSLSELKEREGVELLLIADSLLDWKVRSLGVENILVLSEGSISKENSSLPAILKYQSVDKIIKEIMDSYIKLEPNEAEAVSCNENLRIIGIYSPIGRCGKTSLALTLGQLLAKKKKVLYINLEEHSGLLDILDAEYKGDLLDMIFYQRQGKGKMRYKIQGMTSQMNRLHYIAPATFSCELKNIKSEEWIDFLGNIENYSDYDVVIIDIGAIVSGLIHIFERCDQIYMPILDDYLSSMKIKQFEENLRNTQKDWILEHFCKVKLPYPRAAYEGGLYLEDLLSGPFAEGVKLVCKGEFGG